MQTTMPMADVLTRYLDLASDQMKLTAGNMANVDTPGYKTQGFDFENEFVKQITGDPGTATGLGRSADVDGLVSRPDGNNVSVDREALQLAKTQLQFRTGVALLKGEFSRVMSAIHSEK